MKFYNFSPPAIEHIVLTETRQHHFSWWQKWNASFYLNNEPNVCQRHHIPSFAIFTSFLVLQSLLFVNPNSSLCQLIGHLFDDVSFFSYSLLVNFHKRVLQFENAYFSSRFFVSDIQTYIHFWHLRKHQF